MKTITTTIKWRNAAEELPKESCQVVAWIPSSGYCTTLQYSERHRKFNCGDWVDKKLAVRVAINVDYWCYLDEVRLALTTFPEEKPLPGKFEPARGKKKIKFREEAEKEEKNAFAKALKECSGKSQTGGESVIKLKMTPQEVMQAFRDSARFMQISYNGKDGILEVDDAGLRAYICPVCGNPFAGNRYCDRCGQRLEW